jgi:DNA-binding response OmpR family regulator
MAPPVRVHVVDGDPELAAALAAVLRDAGLHATTGPDASAPCELLVVGLPAPPDACRGLDPHLPIVLLKVASTPYGVLEGWIRHRRGYAILDKPVSPGTLLEVVRALLRDVARAAAADSAAATPERERGVGTR